VHMGYVSLLSVCELHEVLQSQVGQVSNMLARQLPRSAQAAAATSDLHYFDLLRKGSQV